MTNIRRSRRGGPLLLLLLGVAPGCAGPSSTLEPGTSLPSSVPDRAAADAVLADILVAARESDTEPERFAAARRELGPALDEALFRRLEVSGRDEMRQLVRLAKAAGLATAERAPELLRAYARYHHLPRPEEPGDDRVLDGVNVFGEYWLEWRDTGPRTWKAVALAARQGDARLLAYAAVALRELGAPDGARLETLGDCLLAVGHRAPGNQDEALGIACRELESVRGSDAELREVRSLVLDRMEWTVALAAIAFDDAGHACSDLGFALRKLRCPAALAMPVLVRLVDGAVAGDDPQERRRRESAVQAIAMSMDGDARDVALAIAGRCEARNGRVQRAAVTAAVCLPLALERRLELLARAEACPADDDVRDFLSEWRARLSSDTRWPGRRALGVGGRLRSRSGRATSSPPGTAGSEGPGGGVPTPVPR
jgi:hypothetical protein